MYVAPQLKTRKGIIMAEVGVSIGVESSPPHNTMMDKMIRLVMYNRVEIKLDFRKKAEQSSTTTTGAKTLVTHPSATFFGSF